MQAHMSDRPGRIIMCLLREDVEGGREYGGGGGCGAAAIVLVAELEPDLVLMDVQMPGIGGIAATREIKRLSQRTVVLLVSATHPDELPPEATECRADGIIWKGDLRPNVLETIWAKHAYTRV